MRREGRGRTMDVATVIADAERFFREAGEAADEPTPAELEAMLVECAEIKAEETAAFLAEGGIDELAAAFAAGVL